MSFPRYPKYKPSGETWLGSVPDHWAIAALGYRYEVALGKMLDGKQVTGKHLAPYLRNADVQWGRINTDALNEMDFDPEDRDRYSLRRGDLLVCEGGEVGRCAVWEEPIQECYYQKALHRLRPWRLSGDSTRFLQWILRAAVDRGAFAADESKATIAHLPAEAFRRTRLAFPPFNEQRAIAAFLDRETAKIDALVAEQERLIELLAEKRQAVISHAVTKGLDPTAPMKPSGIEWLGDVPAHWRIAPLKCIASVNTGVAKGKDNSGRETISVPYLRVANVQEGYLNLEEVLTIEIPASDLKRYALQIGDVLMNEGGDFDKLGRGCVWHGEIDPCITQNHVFAVRPTLVDSDWLSAVIGSSYAQFFFMSRSKQSTNLASISSSNLMELPVVLPPASDQRALLASIKGSLGRLDALHSECSEARYLLQERRSALISAAVTGQIDVRNAVPVEVA